MSAVDQQIPLYYDGTMAEKFSLKDFLFNKEKVEKIAKEIHTVFPAFKEKDFVHTVMTKFPELELKARISWIAECLKKYLPSDYTRAISILIKALPPPNDPNLTDNDFGDFIYAPYNEFVARYGCTKEHLIYSLDALKEITQRFSAEDAIRFFINAFPKETICTLKAWTKDRHYHVRRLCSEGTRPKLPWSQKINVPITTSLPILDALFSDKARYVTRSVANHINDISKTDPALAVETLSRWKKSKKQETLEMEYIIRHGLRTLVKLGDAEALALLGFSNTHEIYVSKFEAPKIVSMNTALVFSLALTAPQATRAIIDYTIYFQNKAGKMESKKIYKLKTLELTDKPTIVTKQHTLRDSMTTRTLYPGEHKLAVQVNGRVLAEKNFLLQ